LEVRILFLDFDGVLNSTAFAMRVQRSGVLGLDPGAVARVNWILAETGAEVVVSSTWRHKRTRMQLLDILRAVGFVGTLRGKTPDCVPCADPLSKRHVGERGDEIQAWLDSAVLCGLEIESFVILDDDADMRHLKDRLVKTTFAEGLLDEHVERAVKMFKSPPALFASPSAEDIEQFGESV
jgi:HAD domain in Swiss Army Knife RNA repair proteins